MNIIDFIKGLFSSKSADTYNIININDIVQIPKRNKLSKEQVILLDKYKQEYSKILSNKKIFSSKDLTIGSFNEEMSMNINLLLNICINDKENNSFGVHRKENNIDLMIKILKLKLCQNSLSNMETEIITRIIALREIYKEKKYLFSPNKRNSIASEINNLTNTIVIYLNQKNAIQIEVDAYLDSIETLSSSNTISKSDEDKYLIDRKNELLEMISIVMDEVPSIMEGNIKLEIAQLERILEIYVYNHKEDIKKIDRELELLSKENKSVQKREKLLEQITRLEFKYRIFDEFGRHIVTKDQINNLYRVKFDILTIDINNRRESPINKKTNSKELEVYKQIVMEKIEKIVTGNNSYVQSIFKKDASKAISKIVEILKDGDRKFNYNEILFNKFFLTLLLSFDREDGLDKFFEEQSVIKRACNICDFHEIIFKWKEVLPLITIYELLELTESKMPPLFKLYALKEKNVEDLSTDVYKLPDGLTVVYDYKQESLGNNDILFLNNLRKKCDNKFIIFPSTMVSCISRDIFPDSILGVEFNDGLAFVSDQVLENKKLKSIKIPSTLERFPKIEEVEVIEFNDFENSKILNNINEFDEFIGKNFYRVRRWDWNYMTHLIDVYACMRQIVFSSKKFSKKVNINFNNFGVAFGPLPGSNDSDYHAAYDPLIKKIEEKIKSEMGYDFKLTRKK